MQNEETTAHVQHGYYYIWIAAIYILSQQCLYLVPDNSLTTVLAYVLVAILFFRVGPLKIRLSSTSFLMLCPFLLSVISAFVESSLFPSSSIIQSLAQQAQWWVFGFLFYPVILLLKDRVITIKGLSKTILILGSIQVAIGISQYLLLNQIVFTYVSTSERGGSTRLYFPIVLMVLSLFIAVNKLALGANRKRIGLIVLSVLVLIEIWVIQQFRSTLFGVASSLLLGFFLWRSKFSNKVLWSAVLVAVLLIVVSNSTIIHGAINSLLYNSDNSLGMRQTLISFLVENFKNHPLTGCGYPSSNAAISYAASAYRNAYSWDVFAFADGGIYSIAYGYGLLGLSWVVVLWGIMLFRGWRIFKFTDNLLYLLFPLYMVFTMYIDIHWYIHMQFFVMALFLAMQEQVYLSMRKSNWGDHAER